MRHCSRHIADRISEITLEGWHVNKLTLAYWSALAEFPMHRPLPWGIEELSVEESVLSALVYGAAGVLGISSGVSMIEL